MSVEHEIWKRRKIIVFRERDKTQNTTKLILLAATFIGLQIMHI
jgi:hypothetical protein